MAESLVILKSGKTLESGDMLLGESGGLSMVYEVSISSSIPGLLAVETEHGYLYLDPDSEFEVYTGPAMPHPTAG